jgi:hypothetical protein
VGTPSFGQITNTRFPTGESGSSRQIQFATRLKQFLVCRPRRHSGWLRPHRLSWTNLSPQKLPTGRRVLWLDASKMTTLIAHTHV